MAKVEIYIDGSCSGNPGPGGWAAVCEINGQTKVRHSYTTDTITNNKAELLGAIEGLKGVTVKGCEVIIYTDSNYLCTCSEHDKKWLTDKSRPNSELWLQFIETVEKNRHTYKFVKVAGHSGIRLNEIADKYAKAGCAKARHERYEIA